MLDQESNFQQQEGAYTTAVFAPSAAGKSTFIETIPGFEPELLTFGTSMPDSRRIPVRANEHVILVDGDDVIESVLGWPKGERLHSYKDTKFIFEVMPVLALQTVTDRMDMRHLILFFNGSFDNIEALRVLRPAWMHMEDIDCYYLVPGLPEHKARMKSRHSKSPLAFPRDNRDLVNNRNWVLKSAHRNKIPIIRSFDDVAAALPQARNERLSDRLAPVTQGLFGSHQDVYLEHDEFDNQRTTPYTYHLGFVAKNVVDDDNWFDDESDVDIAELPFEELKEYLVSKADFSKEVSTFDPVLQADKKRTIGSGCWEINGQHTAVTFNFSAQQVHVTASYPGEKDINLKCFERWVDYRGGVEFPLTTLIHLIDNMDDDEIHEFVNSDHSAPKITGEGEDPEGDRDNYRTWENIKENVDEEEVTTVAKAAKIRVYPYSDEFASLGDPLEHITKSWDASTDFDRSTSFYYDKVLEEYREFKKGGKEAPEIENGEVRMDGESSFSEGITLILTVLHWMASSSDLTYTEILSLLVPRYMEQAGRHKVDLGTLADTKSDRTDDF